jgi:hypothetical protein
MPLELRKWFQIFTGVLGIATAAVCWFIVRSALAPDAIAAQWSVAFLMVGAMPGFVRMFTLFFPLFLPKIRSGIDL